MHCANCDVSRVATSATTLASVLGDGAAEREVGGDVDVGWVPSPPAERRDSIVASALPRPFASRALTARTTRPDASSISSRTTSARNWSAIGPSLTCSFAFHALVAGDLDELGAGHARDDCRDVVQQAPGVLARGGNVEGVLEPHQEVTIVAGGARLSRWQGIAGSSWSL